MAWLQLQRRHLVRYMFPAHRCSAAQHYVRHSTVHRNLPALCCREKEEHLNNSKKIIEAFEKNCADLSSYTHIHTHILILMGSGFRSCVRPTWPAWFRGCFFTSWLFFTPAARRPGKLQRSLAIQRVGRNVGRKKLLPILCEDGAESVWRETSYRFVEEAISLAEVEQAPRKTVKRVRDHATGDVPLRIIYIGDKVGFGVEATEMLHAGDYLINYSGVRIPDDSSMDSHRCLSYLWQCVDDDGRTEYIDAARYGNESRFINHYSGFTGEPNVMAEQRFIRGHWHVLLFCITDICPGEQLLLVKVNCIFVFF